MTQPDPRVPADRPTPRPARPRGFPARRARALTAILIVLCAILAWPFLPALAWGVASRSSRGRSRRG